MAADAAEFCRVGRANHRGLEGGGVTLWELRLGRPAVLANVRDGLGRRITDGWKAEKMG